MIPVIELARFLRFSLGDMQGINISDEEIIEAINQSARQLYERFSEGYVYAGVKRVPQIYIDPDGGTDGQSIPVYELPADFIRVHQITGEFNGISNVILSPASRSPVIEGEYRIVGMTLYAPKGVYSVEYYYHPARIETLEDDLDVPETMRPYIEKIALAVYKHETEKEEYLIERAVQLYSMREISHIEDIGPVQILGGAV